jgi:hypothetical protein
VVFNDKFAATPKTLDFAYTSSPDITKLNDVPDKGLLEHDQEGIILLLPT